MLDVDCGFEFPMLETHPHISYLDSASTSLTPQVVIDAISDYYTNHNTNTSRGVDRLLYETSELFEGVRKKVQLFLNAPTSDEIIFTRGTTESLNTIAFGLLPLINANDEIIINISEHHANIIPWQEVASRSGAKLRYCPIMEDGSLDLDELSNMISPKTKVVSFAHVTNVLGSYNDPQKVTALVKGKNNQAIVVVDGAQGIIQEQVDVQTIGCDFYAFSGHKLYGPTGVGVLYGKTHLLNKMSPLTFGGDMNASVELNHADYKDTPHRFEAGTMMIAEVLGLGAAIDFAQTLDYGKKQEHIQELRQYAFAKLKQFDHILIYNEKNQTSSTIAFNIKGLAAHDAASMFSDNNVVIRAGHHCAQLLLEHLDAISSLRASFSIYNTNADVDRFVQVVEILADEGAFLDALFK